MLKVPVRPKRINREPLIENISFRICVTHISEEGNIKKGMDDKIDVALLTPSFSTSKTILIVLQNGELKKRVSIHTVHKCQENYKLLSLSPKYQTTRFYLPI